jgi:hypothetical protein
MKEAPGSSETSVLTRATRRNNPEDTFLLCIASVQLMYRVLNLTATAVAGQRQTNKLPSNDL